MALFRDTSTKHNTCIVYAVITMRKVRKVRGPPLSSLLLTFPTPLPSPCFPALSSYMYAPKT